MKKEVILVPKDKCPLDVLAEMGERIKNSWIFLHENAYEKLKSTCDTQEKFNLNSYHSLSWNATDNYPETNIRIYCNSIGVWYLVSMISAVDISFKHISKDPEDIFFLKMEE